MNSFINNLIEGNSITPPEVVLNNFRKIFENAVKTEWHQRADYYEALFYNANIEHLALFDGQGILREYKMYLPEGHLPSVISSAVPEGCEIMNKVLINQGNSINYEIIYRDKNLKRYLLLLNETGSVLKQQNL
jgi:hypothetical protein